MTEDTDAVTDRLVRPIPVNGTVVDVDTGYPRSIVLTVEKDGERFYETYELVSVDVETDGA